MLKSSIFAFRTASACNIKAYFSIRPYTREQRTIKTIEDQRQRLEKARLRSLQTPLILQPQIRIATIPDLETQDIIASKSKPTLAGDEPKKTVLLDHDKLKHIYNLSNDGSELPINLSCSGCGAQFHGNDPGTHGFIPTTEIDELRLETKGGRRKSVPKLPKLCIRCQLIGQYKSALTVCPLCVCLHRFRFLFPPAIMMM